MALQKFKSFIRNRQGNISTQAEESKPKQVTNEADITDAVVTIVGSELSVSERQLLWDSFINGIQKMTDGGHSIMAIAVALE
jgi:hypothetical protein